jgi:hypothetical protein
VVTRLFLPAALFTVEVALIALAAVWAASLALHSTPVDIATGVTAAWLAQAFLPCPCHRCGGRR